MDITSTVQIEFEEDAIALIDSLRRDLSSLGEKVEELSYHLGVLIEVIEERQNAT